MAKLKVAVYIGRFQPFHNGHAHILSCAAREYDAVIVIIGSSFRARDFYKNPFTSAERQKMVADYWRTIAGKRAQYFGVFPVRDQEYNNPKWLQTVQEFVSQELDNLNAADADVSIIGSDRDETTWYLKSFPQWHLDLREAVPSDEDLSATNLRDALFSRASQLRDIPETTQQFLNSFVKTDAFKMLVEEYEGNKRYRDAWSVAPYPPTFLTVDAVVIQSGHVLVVERGQLPGKGLWALPGGFVNQRERLEDAVIRELLEETGIRLVEGRKSKEITMDILRKSIVAKEIFDKPDRSARGRTVTVAYVIRLDDTRPLPKVKGQFVPLEESGGVKIIETSDVMWVPIHVARSRSENWFEDHSAILDTAVGMITD